MISPRNHHPNRVCSEVPGGEGGGLRLIGRLLTILTVPIASTGADEDPRARRGLSRNAEPKQIAALVCPFHPRALNSRHPRESGEGRLSDSAVVTPRTSANVAAAGEMLPQWP